MKYLYMIKCWSRGSYITGKMVSVSGISLRKTIERQKDNQTRPTRMIDFLDDFMTDTDEYYALLSPAWKMEQVNDMTNIVIMGSQWGL